MLHTLYSSGARRGLEVKNIEVMRPFMHPTLYEVARDLIPRFPGPFLWTSLWRPDDPGIHGIFPLRAMDVRSRHLSPKAREMVVEYVNSTWIYDPNRPEKQVCIHHDVGLGEHFHIQVHKNTRRRQ